MALLPPVAVDLLATQDMVATRRQLLDCGLSKETVRWNSGRKWRVLLPNTYLLQPESATVRQRHIAALLYAGPGSAITGLAAARFHGLRAGNRSEAIEVVTPPSRRRRSVGYVTIRPSLLVDSACIERGPLRYVSVSRACVDTAAALRSTSAREALFIEASQKGLASLDELAEWIHRLRSRDAAGLHGALAAAASGAWSLPELRLLDLMATSSSLPEVWPNAKINDASGLPLLTPDAWFDDVAMAVLVHSRRHHSEADLWDNTVSRDAGLVMSGIVVAGVTPHQIDHEPGSVLSRIEATHAAASVRPRPNVTAYEREGWLKIA